MPGRSGFQLVTFPRFGYPCRLMNWVFLTPIKGPDWGGMANWFRNLAVGLQERGDRCVMIGRPDSLWPEVCRVAGLTFEPFRFPGDLAVWEIRKLAAILRRHQPDAGVVKGFRQARFLRYAQPSIAVAVKLPFSYDLKDEWVDRVTYRYAVDRIFTDSIRTRRAFLNFPWVQENKIVTVHNGVAPPLEEPDRLHRRLALRTRLGVPDDKLVVAYCGRFTALKRVTDVLDAFLRAGLPGRAECWLIGEGSLKAELEARAARPEFAGSVRFVGWVERTREWLPACDILIHPSGTEGLPNVVLEAMACGVSVIATRAGGTAEIIRDSVDGFLANIGDVPGMAARLSDLADDAALRSRFSLAARDRVSTSFTLRQMVDGVRAAMRDVVGCRTALRAVPISDAAGWMQVRHPDYQAPDDWARRGVSSPHALKTFRLAMRLALRGAYVVPHLAAGWPRTGASVLLTDDVPAAAAADAWRTQHASQSERRQFAVAAGFWLGRLHAAGILSNDIQAGNVVVSEDVKAWRGLRFHLRSLDNCKTHAWVTAQVAARNMGLFYRSFNNGIPHVEQLKFMAAYRKGRGISRHSFRRMLARMERLQLTAPSHGGGPIRGS
jgi:glycosyltransferase involved in cell wall biosynthesis